MTSQVEDQNMENDLESTIKAFVSKSREDLEFRWNKWEKNLYNNEMYEVIIGLLSRQTSLSFNISKNPGIWNHHTAPVLLRSMTDVHINLAWILDDPEDRSKKFIEYGLGQLKLEIEHRKKEIKKAGQNPKEDAAILKSEEFLNSQHFSFLTDVNLGQWSGVNTRKMAEDCGLKSFYNLVYTPFSAAVHSTWHHIRRCNLKLCNNPLHGWHCLPEDPDFEIDFYYWQLAAKYLDKSNSLFDTKFNISPNRETMLQFLENRIFKNSESVS